MGPSKWLVTALGVLSTLGFTAPAAQADDVFAAATCVFHSGNVSGESYISTIPDDLAEQDSWEPSGLLDHDGWANFSFRGPVTCAGADVAGTDSTVGSGVEPVLTGVHQFDAFGRFDNVVCGTGSFTGTANLSGGGNTYTSINMHMSATFVHGAGPLSLVVDDGWVGGPLTPWSAQEVSGGGGHGVGQFSPTTGHCHTGERVTQFLWNGAFTLQVSGSDAS